MSNLLNRIKAIESKLSPAKIPDIFHIKLEGDKATLEEQRQIDDAEARGDFVICRIIVSPRN